MTFAASPVGVARDVVGASRGFASRRSRAAASSIEAEAGVASCGVTRDRSALLGADHRKEGKSVLGRTKRALVLGARVVSVTRNRVVASRGTADGTTLDTLPSLQLVAVVAGCRNSERM